VSEGLSRSWYDLIMTDAEKKELELLRELRHWLAANVELNEWWDGGTGYRAVRLQDVDYDGYLKLQDLLDASYAASQEASK
jgi:hypothetical protein